MDGCIFCRIASGDVPADILYESDTVVAFLDAFPLAPGHCLVIPRAHHERLQDMPPETRAGVFEIAGRLAERTDSLSGATIMAVHNGRQSGQEVPHVHVHLIPRSEGDGAGPVHSMFSGTCKLGDDKRADLASRLRL